MDRRDIGRGRNVSGLSTTPVYRDIRTRVSGVETLAAYGMQDVSVGDEMTGGGTRAAFVSGNYFDVFRIRPQRGRFILPDEEGADADHLVAVISDHLWREKFGADEHILGQKLPIGRGAFTIIGIAPPDFTGLHPEGRTNLWIPFTMANVALGGNAGVGDRSGRPMQLFGRLSPGATVAQVQSSADAIASDLARARPATDSLIAFHVAVRDRLTTIELAPAGFRWSTFVWLIVALLHLVACSNVASLMLARASARRRELGVRVCLGATRARILAQSLTEALVLATLGAVGGLIVGRWLTSLLASMQFLSATGVQLDIRIVAIVGALTLLTVLQFGLLPALEASRADPLAILRGTGAGGRVKHSCSEMVVVSQVAISLLLIANAAAFVRLLHRQSVAPLGYDDEHLIVATIAPPRPGYSGDWWAHYNEAMARASGVPGVRSVAASVGAPLFRSTWRGELSVPGRIAGRDDRRDFSLQLIGPGYFTAIGAPLVSGREFTTAERADTSSRRLGQFTAVIINESLARYFWPGQNALGKQLVRRGSPPATVVGVVRDIHDVSTVNIGPRAYFPMLEFSYPEFEISVRFAGDAADGAARLRSALDGSEQLGRPIVRTMAGIRNDATSTSRVGSIALSIAAAIALLLTSVGLYGLVAMWAARRRAEIGIRLALGATASHVHALLISNIGKLVGIGSVLGLTMAFGLVQLERGSMGPIISLDPTTIMASLAVFAFIGGRQR